MVEISKSFSNCFSLSCHIIFISSSNSYIWRTSILIYDGPILVSIAVLNKRTCWNSFIILRIWHFPHCYQSTFMKNIKIGAHNTIWTPTSSGKKRMVFNLCSMKSLMTLLYDYTYFDLGLRCYSKKLTYFQWNNSSHVPHRAFYTYLEVNKIFQAQSG